MAGLVKLTLIMILVSSGAIYGGDIWDSAKGKISQFDFLTNRIDKAENILKEAKEKVGSIDFDQKAKLEEGLKSIEETKTKLEEIKNSDATLVEKTFENLKDLKEGVKNLFSKNPCSSQKKP